jgi:hypothetical protein
MKKVVGNKKEKYKVVICFSKLNITDTMYDTQSSGFVNYLKIWLHMQIRETVVQGRIAL